MQGRSPFHTLEPYHTLESKDCKDAECFFHGQLDANQRDNYVGCQGVLTMQLAYFL